MTRTPIGAALLTSVLTTGVPLGAIAPTEPAAAAPQATPVADTTTQILSNTSPDTAADMTPAVGGSVEMMNFDGVTHEFFGMGAVVPQAAEAMDFATSRLRAAFGP